MTGGWNFACPDWEQRLRAGRSLVPDLPLDPVAVARAVSMFNLLRLPDVPGNPPLAEAAGDWARDVVAALFGSVDATGARRVRKLFQLVPKKNAKTTTAAAIMVTALLMDRDPAQEYLLLGPTQEIASRGFRQAAGMIRCDPDLSARLKIRDHLKVIEDLVTGSVLKVQTFDARVATGAIPKGVLVDELHILGQTAYAADVLGQLSGGMIARPDAFMAIITTQSDKPPAGVFKTELKLARGIRDGRITGDAATTLPILYEFPESIQTAKPDKKGKRAWENATLWPMVLPNLGRSIRLDLLKQGLAEAKEKGEEELRRWASQHLNIQIGLGLHSERWVGADYWEAATDPTLTLDTLIERSEVIVAGIDGGGLDDLLGLALVGRCRETQDWLVWMRAWAHNSVLERRPIIASALQDFAAADEMVICNDPEQDLDEVAALLQRIRETGLMPEDAAVGLDPAGVGALVDKLVDAGFDGDKQLRPIGQGFRLSSAVWTAERKLSGGSMVHADQALGNWVVGNAKAEQAGNAVLITKAAAGKAKIDPLIAMFNAVKLMERRPVAAKPVIPVDDWIRSYG